jgi:hypothetical protein
LDTAPEAVGKLEAGQYVADLHLMGDESTPDQSGVLRPRRWPYVASIVILAAGLLTVGAGYVYTTNSAEQWRTTSDKTARDLSSMTAERDDLKQKNTTLASELGDTTKKLNDTTTQLNSANDRIRSLANEKAQIGDTAAVLTSLVANSQKVANETAECIHQHQDLETLLGGPRPYDHGAWLTLYTSVDSVCDVAWKDANSLTSAIQGLGG